MKLPVIALVGRPNVGKSTLFNKIVGKKVAITEDIPGITRDRIYAKGEYNDYQFNVIDTGGITTGKNEFDEEIRMQAKIAIEEADLVVFIVDGKEGLTNNDYVIRDILKKAGKKVIVVINKMDSKISQENMYDFYQLGFDDYIPISAEHSTGINDLLDAIVSNCDVKPIKEYAEDIIKFCVIGRPNVGKSSLINALINQNRMIVSDVAGTTRDAIDTSFTYEQKEFVVIDTAGLRKRGQVWESIEKYSVLRAMKAIERSDICLVVIDANEGITEQDTHIAGYAKEAGKGIILVVNKWDLIKNMTMDEFREKISLSFPFIAFAPIVFLSALTTKRVHTIMPEIIKVADNIKREIKDSILNEVIMDAVMLTPPPSYKGKRLKVFYATQTGIKPPKFTLYVNDKHLIHFSYYRYLENRLRENFDFTGTAIDLQFKNKAEE